MKKRKNKTTKLKVTLLILVFFAGLIILLQYSNSKAKTTPSVTAPKPQETAPNTSKTSDVAKTSTVSNDKQTTSATSAGADLITPVGNFVSSHNSSISGTIYTKYEQSVCNTTPGATCTIVFTKDNSTKSLPAKVVDSTGTVYWDWVVQDIGLTPGSWKITARATLNNQTKTADDSVQLVIQP